MGRKEGAGEGVSAAPLLTCDPGRLLVVKLRHFHQELVDGWPPTALSGPIGPEKQRGGGVSAAVGARGQALASRGRPEWAGGAGVPKSPGRRGGPTRAGPHFWSPRMTPTGQEGSLEAQEVIDDEDSGRHVVAIPTAGRLMRVPEQADGNIKERIWCGEPPTAQSSDLQPPSLHQAGSGEGRAGRPQGAGGWHRTRAFARARAPARGFSLTGAEEVEKKSVGCHKRG